MGLNQDQSEIIRALSHKDTKSIRCYVSYPATSDRPSDQLLTGLCSYTFSCSKYFFCSTCRWNALFKPASI